MRMSEQICKHCAEPIYFKQSTQHWYHRTGVDYCTGDIENTTFAEPAAPEAEPPAVRPAQETHTAKNKSTQQGREFWNHVESIAVQVRADAQTTPQPASAEPSKPKCPDCNAVGLSHCSDPANCGGVYWPDAMYRKLEQERDELKGAMRAQDERERIAATRLGMIHTCDWPDEVADELEAARAKVASLQAILDGSRMDANGFAEDTLRLLAEIDKEGA